MKEIDHVDISIAKARELNERHYGELQGKSKAATIKEFGEKQMKIWRHSYLI